MTNRMAKTLIVSILLLLDVAAYGGALTDGAAAALDQHRQNQAVHPHWLLSCDIDGVTVSALARGSDHSRSFTLHCTYFRDGPRIDVRTVRFDDGRPVRAWRSIINGWYVSYQVPPAGKLALSGLFAAEGSQFIGAAMPSGVGALEGYAAGDYRSFDEIVATASQVRAIHDTVNGEPCVRVEADSADHGLYTVWFDPKIDYSPLKIVVQKLAQNYFGGSRLDQWTRLAPGGSRGTVLLRSISFTMDDAKYDKQGGRWFPLQCRVTRVHEYADGNSETTTMICKRTALDLNPDLLSAKAFVPELREHAPLANLVDNHLPYQWTNDGPVAQVDEAVVAQMDRTAHTLRQELDNLGNRRAR